MKKTLTMALVALPLVATAPEPAAADTTETLAYTFALTLAGTIAGAYAGPLVVPAVAPGVATAYSYIALPGLDAALVPLGASMAANPRLVGSVVGMTAGLVGGLYIFGEEAPDESVAAGRITTNTVVTIER